MQIAEFVVYRVRIELRKAIRHASHARNETESIIASCRLRDGATGWGEGLPREYVTGETIDAAWDLLGQLDLPAHFAGTITGIPEVLQRLDRLRLPQPPGDDRECYGNSLRCAIELSLLDAVCRSEGIPLSAVTSMIPETIAIRGASEQVRYGAPFTAMSVYGQISRAVKLRFFGFRDAKVKTGVEGVDDAAMLRRIRWVLGPDFDLRIDANEAWSCQTLAERLKPLIPSRISSVEQPVPHEEVSGLAHLRSKLGIPFMLDESLCSLTDGRRAIEDGTCDLFNIRLSKCGGYLNSLRLAGMADAAGLGYQLGCQVGETGILSAAGRHFATSVANIRHLEGSYDRFLVHERLINEEISFGWGGLAPALGGPGLGITVDRDAIDRVMLQQSVIPIEG